MADPRELLLAERARAVRRVAALQREFAGVAEAASAGGTDDEHDPEGATLAFERQHTAALLDQARERLVAIDAALARLEDGRYGRCDRCGQPIGADRRAARPAALTCIRCAALLRVAYSARNANAVRVLAAQPAGPSAPATAMISPDRPSRTSSHGWNTLSTEGGTSVCAA